MTKGFLLHDESTIVGENPQASSSVLLLKQESELAFQDCSLKKYLENMKLYETHIDGIYLAYRDYDPIKFSTSKKVLADPASIRGTDPSLLNLQANLAYVSVKQGNDTARSLSMLWQNVCELEAMIMRDKIHDSVGNGIVYTF